LNWLRKRSAVNTQGWLRILWLCLVVSLLLTGAACRKQVTSSDSVLLTASDTPGDIITKAINVVPSPRQLLWQEGEFISFIHFGVNTFSGREWGTGKEDPKSFNPQKLDTDQWCKNIKAAGMTKVILTAKHHDGFCLWPTRYTTQSVASSDWRDGQGDVLRDLVTSCAKYELQVGVYLSPADLYQIEHPQGLYGNLSEVTERVIPRPVPGRPFKDHRTFTYECDDYNEYFMNQLFELLTEYGPVHEVWLDGAHPKRKGGQTYTYSQWYALVRALAPEAVIFGKGPDVRWCGNEAGKTRDAEWNVIPIPKEPNEYDWPDMTGQDLASMAQLNKRIGQGGTLHWYPAETNTSIRDGWFWRDEMQHVKRAEEILDIWYRSVGGNTVFLLNIPPNRDGLLAERDCAVLQAVGAVLRPTFSRNLAKGAQAKASAKRSRRFSAQYALDGDTSTCWMPDEGETLGQLVLTLDGKQTFNRVMLQEQIQAYGQRIEAFAVDVLNRGQWRTIAEGKTVGYKRICRTVTVTASKIRIRILNSRVCPTISNIGLFLDTTSQRRP